MRTSDRRRAAIAAVRDDDVIDAARALLRIEGGPGQERQMVESLSDDLPRASWSDVRVIDGQHLTARIPGGVGPSLCMTAYLDSPPAGLMKDAYDARIEDGAAYGKTGPVIRGRGACTKATLAAMIGAGAALRRAGLTLSGDLILAGTSHDDGGVRAALAGVPAVAMAVVGEPTGNALGIAARGIAWLDLRIRGRAVHAGVAESGVNPLDKLPEVLLALRRIPLPSQDGLPPALLTPVLIDTFATPPRTPHWITLRLDRRLLPGETAEGVRSEIDRALDALRAEDRDLDATVTIVDSMMAFRADIDSSFVRAFRETIATVTGLEPPLAVVPHGTSAGLLASLGTQSAMFGPASIEDRNDDEHVVISKLTDAARILAGLAAFVLD